MDKSKWYFNSVFYHLYPQSFFDTNGDGIGDLEGMIRKLDYIQSLGVDAVWPNSLWMSYSFKDAGYDIVDYKAIAPRYGNLKTFDRFIAEAHKRNIKVLGEMDFAATSDEHPWFKQSQKMEKNRYSKWFVWCQNPQSMKIRRGLWMFYESERHESYYVGWLPHQPWLNYGFPGLGKKHGDSYDDPDLKALREELKDIVRFWLDRGVDGFRCDAVEVLIPQEKGLHENAIRFWSEIREFLDSYDKDLAYIAEGWDNPLIDIIKCTFNGCFFKMPFSSDPANPYGFKKEQRFFSPEGGDITWFVDHYLSIFNEAVKHGGILNMVSGNHDLARMSEVCRKDEIIKTYFAFLLTYPTAPFIYYGDEIGMQYWRKLPSREGAGPRAGSRTPMQWNAERNAGFSRANPSKLYFPVNEDYPARNVERQEADPSSILNTVRKLVALRKSSISLGPFASIRHLHLEKGSKSYIYSRYDGQDACVVALNPSDTPATVMVELTGKEEEFKKAQYLALEISSQEVPGITIEKKLIFQLPQNFFGIYRVS